MWMSAFQKKVSRAVGATLLFLISGAFAEMSFARTAFQDCQILSGDQAISACDRAIADYNEAIRLNPQYAIAFYNRGLAWEAKNDLTQTLNDFRNFARLSPNDPGGLKAVQRIESNINAQKP
jgi:tetratricopeptide (TPR) repeat protein